MFKWLKQKEKNQAQETKKNILCGINLELNTDGSINILCSWPNFDKNNVEKIDMISTEYSLLLYYINKGLLSKEIINTLTNLIHDNNEYDTLFVNMCLTKWIDYLENDDFESGNGEPLIKPSSVFNK